MPEPEKITRKRNEEWEKMERTIIALVKEHYRLLGKSYYEQSSKELEAVIKGEG